MGNEISLLADVLFPENDDYMHVCGNSDKMFGATQMLVPQALEKVADTLGDSFYILPSSIHEFIAIRESRVDSVDELKNMVQDVNRTEVADNEILSDNVYFYNRVTKELAIA